MMKTRIVATMVFAYVVLWSMCMSVSSESSSSLLSSEPQASRGPTNDVTSLLYGSSPNLTARQTYNSSTPINVQSQIVPSFTYVETSPEPSATAPANPINANRSEFLNNILGSDTDALTHMVETIQYHVLSTALDSEQFNSLPVISNSTVVNVHHNRTSVLSESLMSSLPTSHPLLSQNILPINVSKELSSSLYNLTNASANDIIPTSVIGISNSTYVMGSAIATPTIVVPTLEVSSSHEFIVSQEDSRQSATAISTAPVLNMTIGIFSTDNLSSVASSEFASKSYPTFNLISVTVDLSADILGRSSLISSGSSRTSEHSSVARTFSPSGNQTATVPYTTLVGTSESDLVASSTLIMSSLDNDLSAAITSSVIALNSSLHIRDATSTPVSSFTEGALSSDMATPTPKLESSSSSITSGMLTNITFSDIKLSDSVLSTRHLSNPPSYINTTSSVRLPVSSEYDTYIGHSSESVSSADVDSPVTPSLESSTTSLFHTAVLSEESFITSHKSLSIAVTIESRSSTQILVTSTTPVFTSSISLPKATVSPSNRSRMNSFRVRITFKDRCKYLRTAVQLQMEFFESLISVLTTTIDSGVSRDNIQLDDFGCDPLSVGIVLRNVSSDQVITNIKQSINNSSFIVPIIANGRIVQFTGEGVRLMDAKEDGQPNKVDTSMEQTDIIIIASACFLFLVFLFFGSVIVCRECYLRKRASSFNLLDVPHVDLKLTDFSLTRIPRPQMTYFEPTSSRAGRSSGNKTRPNGTERDRDTNDGNKKAVDTDHIHVRLHEHECGLVIGVTGTPPRSPTNDSTSTASSPRSDSVDPSIQSLLKGDDSNKYRVTRGATNPNYLADEEVPKSSKSLIEDDETEQLV